MNIQGNGQIPMDETAANKLSAGFQSVFSKHFPLSMINAVKQLESAFVSHRGKLKVQGVVMLFAPSILKCLSAFAMCLLFVLSACGGGGAGTVGPAPTSIVSQPTDQTVQSGASATFSVTATGDNLSYQWQSSSDGGATWLNTAAGTLSTLATGATSTSQSGSKFRVQVTGGGGVVTSSAVTLTVSGTVQAVAVVTQPADVSAVAGTSPGFSVTATGTSPVYQWQTSTDSGATWSDVAGATAATYSPASVAVTDSGRLLRVKVSNSQGSVLSRAALLTVTQASAAPSITTQPLSVTVAAPGAASFSVVAVGSPSPSYQWQQSGDNGASYANISGANAASYALASTGISDSGKVFRVVVSNASGTVNSTPAVLTVNAAAVAPAIQSQPGNQSVIPGTAASFAVSATGSPSPTYQWQVSVDNGNTFTNINGATAASYTTAVTSLSDSGKQFRVVLANSAGSVTSVAAMLSVAAGSAVPVSITTSGLAQPGRPAVFTVTELNTGSQQAGNHYLRATVPAYTSVRSFDYCSAPVDASGSCPAGATVSWFVSTNAGQTSSRQFSATISASSPPPVGTLLSSSATTETSGGGSATASAVAGGATGLQLGVGVNTTVASAGDTLIYTFTLANNAALASAATALTLPLPAGTSFVSASDGGALSAGTVTWPVGPLAAGASGQRVLTVRVSNPLNSTPILIATADLRDASSLASLARGSSSTVVNASTIRVGITASPGPVQVGQPVVFTVTELNTGSQQAGNHYLRATVPAYTSVRSFDYCSAPVDASGSCPAGAQVSWFVSTNAGQTSSRQFSATVSTSNSPPNGTLLSSAVVSEAGGSAATAHAVAGAATGLQLGLGVNTTVATAGDTLTYTVTLTNNAAIASAAATLAVPVPAGTSFVSASNGGALSAGTVTWPVGSLAAGASGQRALTVQVNSPLNGTPMLVATADLRDASSLASLARGSSSTVVNASTIRVGITASPGPAQAGQPVVFTVTELNTGSQQAGNHYLRATVPAYTSVRSFDYCSAPVDTSGSCPAGAQVSWFVSTNAGQTSSRQFSATVSTSNPPPNGTLLSSAVISEAGGSPAVMSVVVAP